MDSPTTPDLDAVAQQPAPSTWRTMVQPRWLAVLVFALLVASGFAWLGQWQLSRAVQNAVVVERDTETVRPLDQVAVPGRPLDEAAADTMVSVAGEFADDDWLVVSRRVNDGITGYWVVGRLELAGGGSAAVAVGWTADLDAAQAVAAQRRIAGSGTGAHEVTGRLTVADPITASHEQLPDGVIDTMAPAYLINVWAGSADRMLYGFIVSHDPAPTGLTAISSPKPEPAAELNWLNLFYAAEWVIFAGFALFLWWRLVADDVRRQREDRMGTAIDHESVSHPDHLS